jgi:hypothetical protein
MSKRINSTKCSVLRIVLTSKFNHPLFDDAAIHLEQLASRKDDGRRVMHVLLGETGQHSVFGSARLGISLVISEGRIF